jgi:ribosomal protein S18 acetylase RimI-like enzyme
VADRGRRDRQPSASPLALPPPEPRISCLALGRACIKDLVGARPDPTLLGSTGTDDTLIRSSASTDDTLIRGRGANDTLVRPSRDSDTLLGPTSGAADTSLGPRAPATVHTGGAAGRGASLMEGLSFRKATPMDTERIAAIINDPPGQEAVAIAGCVEAARELGMALVRLPDGPQGWQRTVVGELDGEVVGVLQTGSVDFSLTPRLALLALRVFGVGIVSVLGRARARQRVEPKAPEGAYNIIELHVDPAFRNRGVGGALLDHAEEEACRAGYRRMCLTTTTINAARRLYERHGFRVVETLTDAAYERYTGIAGRHLMVKELT